MKFAKKMIDPTIESELEYDFFHRSPPAAYTFMASGLFFGIVRMGVKDHLLFFEFANFMIVFSSLLRLIISKKALAHKDQISRQQQKLHKFVVLVNGIACGTMYSIIFWENDLASISSMAIFIYAFMISAGAVSSLCSIPRIQTLVFASNMILPAVAVILKFIFLGITTKTYLFFPTAMLAGFFYISKQGWQYYRHLVQRYEYENVIRSEREYLQSVIDSIPGFLINLDSKLKVASASKSVLSVLGSEFQEGLNISTIQHPLVEKIKEFKDSSSTYLTLEMAFKTQDKESWFLISLFRTKVERHRFIIVAAPVNELIKARQDLASQTIRAMNASKLASLGEMAAGVGHEINNPVAIIFGYTTEIKRMIEKDNPPQKESMLDRLEKQGKAVFRIKKIVSSLRLLSREASNDPLEVSELQPIIEDTISLCQQKFVESSIQLIVDPVPEIKFPCRPTQVSQVLINLINNAYDAVIDNKSDQKLVKIKFHSDMKNLDIVVEDSAGNLPDEIKEKIFEPFFTTKAVGKGTGLGLSISKTIMDEHKGRISCYSKDGKTEFLISFPTTA